MDRLQRCLEVIERDEPRLHALTTIRRAEAIAEEAARGPLHGRVLVVKDNMDVAGTVRTDGLAPPHPPPAIRDATAVARLRRAGAIVVAKANLEELSFGATTRNRHWGTAANPWDESRIAGGSSGGSAVAVAAGMAELALGTDTGGSIRNPAAFCGISALRPTTGTIAMDGVTPLAPDFDVVGPMARSARDLKAMLAVLTATAPTADPPAGLLRGLRVGLPGAFFLDDLDDTVAAALDLARRVLAGHGAQLIGLDLHGAADTPQASATLLNAEAAVLHAGFLDDPRVDEQVKERLRLGAAVATDEHDRAAALATKWSATVADALTTVDVLLVPTTPFCAPQAAGANMVALSRRINRCNAAWSLAGVPALTLPCFATGRLPAGLQLVVARDDDARLLDIGVALQRETDWHERRPVRVA